MQLIEPQRSIVQEKAGGARGCARGRKGRAMGINVATMKTIFCGRRRGAAIELGTSEGVTKALWATEHNSVQQGQDF